MESEIESLFEELVCGEDDRAESAATKLAGFGEPLLPKMRLLLESDNPDVRWWVIRTLAQFESPPPELLVHSLTDESQEVKQCAALAISHHPTNLAIRGLLTLLEDPDSVSSHLAAAALISLGADALPFIFEKLSNLQGIPRVEAIRAIACIADHRSIPILMAALEEDSLAINYWAEEGLERLGLGMVYMKAD